MPDYRSRTLLVVKVVAMGLVGALVGSIASCTGLVLPADYARRVTVYPLPHHFPKYPGGVSFRYAMAHDVIHERYTHHGKAYYAERNRRVLQALAGNETAMSARKEAPPQAVERRFALLDDLGAGYEALGRHDEAVRVLRDKLREQKTRGDTGRKLYTTYANLGTFLIHGSFQKAVAGDKAAKERLREGLGFIHQAIAVNPQAHFGREAWQAVAVEFLLAVMDRPGLLLKYDLLGDRLDRGIKGTEDHPLDVTDRHEWSMETGRRGPLMEHWANDSERCGWRKFITRAGAEGNWTKDVNTSHAEPVPFDEPVLGIIGMWRLGGGPNPHFALALGEIMLRVGQRYVAWSAYERAVEMKDRFWADPDIQRNFVEHCRARQAVIERGLPEQERAALRPRFRAELQHGRDYQQAYQAYEAERIGARASIDDPHFYDAFYERQGRIASPVGEADRFVTQRVGDVPRARLSVVLFFAGLFAFAAALLTRRRPRPAIT